MSRLIDRARAVYRRWIAIALIVVAVAGVLALPLLPPRAQPVRFRGDADLRHLVFSERSSVDLRYGLYEDLRVAVDGGTLIVPPDGVVVPYIALALSDITVVEREFDPAIPADLPKPRFSGDHDGTGEVLEYEILPGDDETWWLAREDDLVVVIPASIAALPDGADG